MGCSLWGRTELDTTEVSYQQQQHLSEVLYIFRKVASEIVILLILFLDSGLFIGLEWASHVSLVLKKLAANTGNIRDVGLNPGSGRSPGGGHDNLKYSAPRLPKYSCLKNTTDRGV